MFLGFRAAAPDGSEDTASTASRRVGPAPEDPAGPGPSSDSGRERAVALLHGVAVGDALGSLTEGYWPPEIVAAYGGEISDFPADNGGTPPVRGGTGRPGGRRARRPRTTDDTAFTLLVGHSITACGRVDEDDIVRRILARPIPKWPGWEEFCSSWSRGEFQTRTGTGGAMRIAPVGILHPISPGPEQGPGGREGPQGPGSGESPDDLRRLIRDVTLATRASHNSPSSVAASAALAAAYSVLVDGGDADRALRAAVTAADLAEREWEGPDDLCPSVARRLRWVRANVGRGTSIAGLRGRGINPGFRAWEAVPAAFAIFLAHQSAREAILCATNLGGDADSVASMAGALAAALAPDSLPVEWVERALGRQKVSDLAEALYALRMGARRIRGTHRA